MIIILDNGVLLQNYKFKTINKNGKFMDSLEEQIRPHTQYWDCYNDCPLEYNHTGKVVKIVEKFAIDFANWCKKEYELEDTPYHNKWRDVDGRYISTEELLIKFKRVYNERNVG